MQNSLLLLRSLLVFLLSVMVCAQKASAAYSANLPGDWTTYGNNPAHTGYYPGTLGGLKFVEKWKTPMPSTSIYEPAIGGGRVFVTAGWYYGNMYLIALDAETGQAIRTNNFGSWYSVNPPTYADGAVYVQRTDSWDGLISQMVRFDATTLATNWMTTFNSQGSYYYAPVVVDGTVLITLCLLSSLQVMKVSGVFTLTLLFARFGLCPARCASNIPARSITS